MKQMVTILRKWNSPEILTIVSDEEISISISLSDFMQAVKSELSPKPICESLETIVTTLENNIGPITWVFTKNEFRQRLTTALEQLMLTQEACFSTNIDIAITKVLSNVKKESCKIM